MMNKDYTIRRMQDDDIQIAIDWAAQEGWNPGINDAKSFYQADNNGFFVGEIDGQAVSVGSAVAYDDQFAFCGLYIVHPKYRGQGYGIALTKERLGYVGLRNAGIDGVVENIPIYERIGYRLAHHNVRYQSIAACPAAIDLRFIPLSQLPFDLIEPYDRLCFPAKRRKFLNTWINQPDAKALGLVENGQLKGYAVRRRCIEGHRIGPLFADDFAIAEGLFQTLQQDIPGEPIFLDIPEINPAAQRLVDQHNMQAVFSTGRMYLKGQPKLADQKIYGITTFELG